jgi:parallel beta-helix repeat protein
MKGRALTGAFAAVILPLTLPATSTAAGPSVSCGVPITRTVTLGADLECASGDGLVIGADRITVDLGGHFVNAEVAIRNQGHDRVTIRHGSAGHNAAYGVLLQGGADYNRIVDLTVSGEVAGIAVYDSNQNLIRDNESYNAGGYGIWLGHARGNTIEQNRMAKENDDGNQGGIYLMDDSSLNRVLNNQASSNAGDGIHVAAGSGANFVAGNTSTWNTDDGIDIDDPSTVVSANVANFNGIDAQGYGIEAVPGTKGAGNSASDNRAPAQCINITCR